MHFNAFEVLLFYGHEHVSAIHVAIYRGISLMRKKVVIHKRVSDSLHSMKNIFLLVINC